MVVFYGLDNFLINEEVNSYLKNKQLTNNDNIINYYLDSDFFILRIEKILNEISSLDLNNNQKIVIINDYYLDLNNNQSILRELITKINQLSKANNNIVIVKILSDKLNQAILDSDVEKILVSSYNKEQLKQWILNKNSEYNIQFYPNVLDTLLMLLPNSISIIDNELKKLRNLNQVIDEQKIRNIEYKYFVSNPYQLIDFWLNKNYLSFWLQYRLYWERNNYDKLNLFLIAAYQLELIRNAKLLMLSNFSNQNIAKKMNLSIFQVKKMLQVNLEVKELNKLLVEAHKLDIELKKGKISKNLIIDLFFCKI